MSGALDGRRILLTRRREQSAALASGLQSLGAEVMAVALLQLTPPRDPEPLARALERLDSYQWLVFTSANTVDAVADLLEAQPRPLPPELRVASLGPATSEAVRARFPSCEVAVEPSEEFRAEGLLAAFGDTPLAGARILLPASERGRDALAAGLRLRGAEVTAVAAYGVSAPEGAVAALRDALARGPHLVVFASPSAVETYCELAGPAGRGVPAAVIGPVTEAAAKAAGLEVRVTAVPSTVPGLVAAIRREFGN